MDTKTRRSPILPPGPTDLIRIIGLKIFTLIAKALPELPVSKD